MDLLNSLSLFCAVYVLATTSAATAADGHLPRCEERQGPCGCQHVVTTKTFSSGVTETFNEVICDAKKNKITNEAMKSRGKEWIKTQARLSKSKNVFLITLTLIFQFLPLRADSPFISI